MRLIPNDCSRCCGANCKRRDGCLRFLTHEYESAHPSDEGKQVVYSEFDRDPENCTAFWPKEQSE